MSNGRRNAPKDRNSCCKGDISTERHLQEFEKANERVFNWPQTLILHVRQASQLFAIALPRVREADGSDGSWVHALTFLPERSSSSTLPPKKRLPSPRRAREGSRSSDAPCFDCLRVQRGSLDLAPGSGRQPASTTLPGRWSWP